MRGESLQWPLVLTPTLNTGRVPTHPTHVPQAIRASNKSDVVAQLRLKADGDAARGNTGCEGARQGGERRCQSAILLADYVLKAPLQIHEHILQCFCPPGLLIECQLDRQAANLPCHGTLVVHSRGG